ncbi:MAG TPA: HAD family hydrolase [Gammaproteobacteria bacterium]|nr:HAD family hydrolase [Gammaproteobacteria bacterium]
MSEWRRTSREVDAVLFDLGNTLVAYYKATEFVPVLRRCIVSVVDALKQHHGDDRRSLNVSQLFERAKAFNQERPDGRVWPLKERLAEIFAAEGGELTDALLDQMTERFLAPILATAKLNPDAIPVLSKIRELGLQSAIVSNTPWGSPAANWRAELARWRLLELVDTAVFCVDVGWRKPAPQVFQHALSSLGVSPDRALFVGDDVRWDIEGARRAGLTPILLGEAPAPADYRTIRRLSDLVPLLER